MLQTPPGTSLVLAVFATCLLAPFIWDNHASSCTIYEDLVQSAILIARTVLLITLIPISLSFSWAISAAWNHSPF